jgi:hypothetical protein
MRMKIIPLLISMLLALIALTSCTPAPTTTVYTVSELKYRLFAVYPDYFWCDPDFYPIARPEEPSAISLFDEIKNNREEFSAILKHLSLPDKNTYTEEEKLQIYREHKKLNYAVQLNSDVSAYVFTIRSGREQGFTYQGKISQSGVIEVTSKIEGTNTCPICLAADTTIYTPRGFIPVEQLRTGDFVYTMDKDGNKILAVLIMVTSVPVPTSFEIIHIGLEGGRNISASPGHPTADGRNVGQLRVGDVLDGSRIISIASLPYGGYTYDVMPDGGTGLYWANGILLKSTLAR